MARGLGGVRRKGRGRPSPRPAATGSGSGSPGFQLPAQDETDPEHGANQTELTIGVQDDGGGIKLGSDAKASPGHSGLAGMRERIQALNGRFVVHQSGGGVRVVGVLPIAR